MSKKCLHNLAYGFRLKVTFGLFSFSETYFYSKNDQYSNDVFAHDEFVLTKNCFAVKN